MLVGNTNCDIACEILKLTEDGNRLDPCDLALVEAAVNDCLTEQGQRAFETLHRRAKEGYTPRPFHGIEHLTYDLQGYVRWKGQIVDHYNASWAYTSEARRAAQEVARRCRILEQRDVSVNTQTVIWRWDDDQQE